MRMVDDPLSNPRMLLCENQQFVEPAKRRSDTQESAGLPHRGHDCPYRQLVPADLSAADRLPLQRVSTIVAAAGVEGRYPSARSAKVITHLRRSRATKWHFDLIEVITVGMGTQ